MSTIGAEMEQLHQLGQTFSRESTQVGHLTTHIGNQVQNTWWKGPAADRFRAAWESEFAPTMRRLEAALQEASGSIAKTHHGFNQVGGVGGQS